VLIRYINLCSDTERNKNIIECYSRYSLKRISAIDGIMEWGDGTYDSQGRWNWDRRKESDLIKDGVLARDHGLFYGLNPPEVACSIMQREAILDFLNSHEDVGFIIEDDTYPLCDLDSFEMPKDADFFCFLGTDHPGYRVMTNENDEIVCLRNLSAYAITRKGAEIAIEAMKPLWCIADSQLAMRSFRSINNNELWPFKRTKDLMVAKAPSRSMIGLSRLSEYTTFSCDGKKPWVDEEWNSIAYDRNAVY
jgi:hypothetical protein